MMQVLTEFLFDFHLYMKQGEKAYNYYEGALSDEEKILDLTNL